MNELRPGTKIDLFSCGKYDVVSRGNMPRQRRKKRGLRPLSDKQKANKHRANLLWLVHCTLPVGLA